MAEGQRYHRSVVQKNNRTKHSEGPTVLVERLDLFIPFRDRFRRTCEDSFTEEGVEGTFAT